MTDVFVSSDSLTVIGGTASVDVNVDYGPQGDRGSSFFVGYGNPNSITHTSSLQVLDIYINVQSTDDDYLVMYQYQLSDGILSWISIGKLLTDQFSSNRQLRFVDGVTENAVDFNVANIVPMSILSSLTKDNFNVQCTFVSDNPIAASTVVGDIYIDSLTGNTYLPVDINAVEYSGGNWVPLHTGSSPLSNVHFFVTVV